MVKKVVTKTVTETTHDNPSNNPSKKKVIKKKTPSSKPKQMTAREREQLLIENFVGLQHAMTNLSMKFGNLSQNIQTLLQVFEEAAKNFMQGPTQKDNEGMLKKIDSLLDQNKTIAKGLVLMEENLRNKPHAEEPRHEQAHFHQVPPQTSRNSFSPENTSEDSTTEQTRIKPKPLPRI
ncbi:hypothetical protein HN604_01710 [archaeon]|nr:hypothetical protein [archaeon]MBT6182969.1 hypothetical protein [archaeon]MBT6606566.1 hypothetical protein [archaeon]MBT7251807.1 hypothetical protein [archaeon]MBT7660778.1 hypothetical protein [archaeon]